MTREDEFIGQLEGYLDEFEGATPLPAGVRAHVRTQLATTKQLGGFSNPLRLLTTNRQLQIALAAVAALAVGLAALSALNPRIGTEPTPTEHPTVDLGIFEPVAGRIVYGDADGIWGVDPAAPADPATRIENVEAGDPLGWSSDGSRLLIARSDPQGGSDLFVLDTDGSETPLTERPRDLRHAAISPDGSRVVFADCTDTLDQDSCPLYSVGADGGPAVMLHEAGVVEGLAFSPDGTQIAYVTGRGDGDHRVWVVDSDGSDAHEIVANDTTVGGGHVRGQHPLAWSPAGDRIALALEAWIYTFASDGSDFTRVIDGDQPYWSPDGSQFGYAIGGFLFVADADGSNVLRLGLGGSGPWHPGRVPTTEAVFGVALHYWVDGRQFFRLPEPTQIHAPLPDGWVTSEAGMTLDSHEAGDSLTITFWAASAVLIDPCHSDARADPPMMQSLELLAGAFVGWWGSEYVGASGHPSDLPRVTKPTSTTVSGFRARYLELRVPENVDPEACFGGRYAMWRDTDGVERHSRPGDISRLWIVEVGPPPEPCCPTTSTPLLVIDATSQGEPSTTSLATLAAIIDSLHIEAPEVVK